MQRARIRADSKTGWGVVAIALAAGLIAAAHVGELPPALPALRAELGLDLISAAYLASLFSVTGMLVAVFIGVLADRADHWRLAVAGLTLMALSGFAGSFAGSGSQLLASRFLEGIGFLAVVVAAPSLIAETATGRDRQMALGLWPGYMRAASQLRSCWRRCCLRPAAGADCGLLLLQFPQASRRSCLSQAGPLREYAPARTEAPAGRASARRSRIQGHG